MEQQQPTPAWRAAAGALPPHRPAWLGTPAAAPSFAGVEGDDQYDEYYYGAYAPADSPGYTYAPADGYTSYAPADAYGAYAPADGGYAYGELRADPHAAYGALNPHAAAPHPPAPAPSASSLLPGATSAVAAAAAAAAAVERSGVEALRREGTAMREAAELELMRMRYESAQQYEELRAENVALRQANDDLAGAEQTQTQCTIPTPCTFPSVHC